MPNYIAVPVRVHSPVKVLTNMFFHVYSSTSKRQRNAWNHLKLQHFALLASLMEFWNAWTTVTDQVVDFCYVPFKASGQKSWFPPSQHCRSTCHTRRSLPSTQVIERRQEKMIPFGSCTGTGVNKKQETGSRHKKQHTLQRKAPPDTRFFFACVHPASQDTSIKHNITRPYRWSHLNVSKTYLQKLHLATGVGGKWQRHIASAKHIQMAHGTDKLDKCETLLEVF